MVKTQKNVIDVDEQNRVLWGYYVEACRGLPVLRCRLIYYGSAATAFIRIS